MRTDNINLWVLWLFIPIAMATYIFGADKKPEDTNVVVQTLVKQVQDLQVVVASQGERIEALEERLKIVEAYDNNVKESDNNIKSTEPADTDTDTGDVTMEMTRQGSFQGMTKNSGILRRGIRAAEGVAFSAYLDHELDMAKDMTIRFNQVIFNDGNHYNTHSGVFTAPTSGVYFFTFSIHDWKSGYEAALRLVVDDVNIVDAEIIASSNSNVMGGNSAVVRVQAGQVVWIQSYHGNTHLYASSAERYDTFSGFLLY